MRVTPPLPLLSPADRMHSMLAVMTLNVGYFMSILAGTFIGSLLVGRYSLLLEH